VRHAWSLAAALSIALLVLNTTVAPTQAAKVKWTHPKAHQWGIQNAPDFITATNDVADVIDSMRCDPYAYDCDPGTLTTDVPENTSIGACPMLTAAIATVRSDGPIPAAQAQRWWATVMNEAVNGCDGLTKSINDSISDPNMAAEAGGQAVANFTAVNELVARVIKYVGRVCIPAGIAVRCSTPV
jgi:hypothetical protein